MGDFPDKAFDRWVTRGPDEDCPQCGGVDGDHDDDCEFADDG